MKAGTEETLPTKLAWRWLLLLAGIKLAVHLACLGRYGYFRDELYFLDCARHWQWGYVDDAPLVAVLAKVSLLLGGSLQAVRLLPALAGAGTVLLAGMLARALGGRGFAQAFTALCVLAAPVFLLEHGLQCVGAFEPLVWLGLALLALRIARTGDGRLWLAFGVLAGLGILLKYTTGLVLVCFLVGMLVSPLRKQLRSRYFLAGATLAVLIFLPTLVWQVRNHWPLLADLANIRRTHKNVELPPVAFLWQQAWMVNVLLGPVWIAGLVRMLRRPGLRFLGAWYLLLLGTMMALHGKDYYLAAIYPLLFAAGSAALEDGLENARWSRNTVWPKGVLVGLAAALVLLLVPAFTPLLTPTRLLAYQARLGIKETKTERLFDGRLMQPFADQFGWREMAEETAALYRALPPLERAGTGIYADNYGQAGAIAQFGPALGLPPVICAHNAYSFWGPPATTPATFICLGCDREGLMRSFESVELGVQHQHPWGMGYENRPIYVCRGLKRRLPEIWSEITWWN